MIEALIHCITSVVNFSYMQQQYLGYNKMGKIQVHGLIASPPTRSALLVAKAVGVPHELIISDPLNKTPEFEKLNPQMQIPVLIDGDLVLAER